MLSLYQVKTGFTAPLQPHHLFDSPFWPIYFHIYIPFAHLSPDFDNHHDQLQKDAQFLCSDHRMDTELLDKLVLQLNRIFPQILSDKEARRVTTDNIWHSPNAHNTMCSHLNVLMWYWTRAVCDFSMCVPAVQEPKGSHQSASSWAVKPPAQEGWGGMWWILQRTSHPRWRHLYQPAHQSLAAR